MKYANLFVREILEKAYAYKWSIQGLGMLRLYLSDSVRLHVWDSRYRITGVSPLHTHPWSFESYVVAGMVNNRRFTESENHDGIPFWGARIKCGAGTYIEDQTVVRLIPGRNEMYWAGQHYCQQADEIHESNPADGTVTLVERTFRADTEHARVFWEKGEFGSAEPRTATPEEVTDITAAALKRWFK
jgi:hypothetical protein